MPGVTVADLARKHGTTRWQIYDWRKQLRKGNLVVPESVASLPVFAELVVDDSATAAAARSDLEIVVGDDTGLAPADSPGSHPAMRHGLTSSSWVKSKS